MSFRVKHKLCQLSVAVQFLMLLFLVLYLLIYRM